jgi:hypothetical protein
MTPYDQHAALGHDVSRYSPNGVDIIEECSTCGARFLHNPCIGYPVTMRPAPLPEAVYLPWARIDEDVPEAVALD